MKKSKFTEEQIAFSLRHVDKGIKVADWNNVKPPESGPPYKLDFSYDSLMSCKKSAFKLLSFVA